MKEKEYEVTVTTKNTKQEIYDALIDAKKKIDTLAQGKSDPAKEEKKAIVEKAIESATESVAAGVFSDDLNKKYNDLVVALDENQKRIEEIYGVEKSLQNLTVLINASKDKKAELDASYDAAKKDLDQRLQDLRTDFNEREELLRADYKRLQDELRTERAREKEEYDYNLKRDRMIDTDKYNDEVKVREAVIAEKEAKTQEYLAEVQAKLDYIADLEAKVAEIPTLIAAAKEAGAIEMEKELGKDYGYKKSMAEKEHAWEVKSLNDALTKAKEDNDKKDITIAELQAKLDAAYEKVTDIATKTAEATGGVKILGSSNNDVKR